MSALERIRLHTAGSDLRELASRDGIACIQVEAEDLHGFCRGLRDDCSFETNIFVTAIDRSPRSPRFELSYMFLSIEHADRVRVVVLPADDEAPSVPSICDLWPGASFPERECFDMFGIVFEGHPDLRRLLMPEGYDHYPLRKDFPHRGIEPDRLYREWDRERRKAAHEGAQGS